jgi:Xaa-Pro aminopeptidase
MTLDRTDGPFPPEEYHDRLTRVKARMAELELDALMVIDGSNITYLTGYLGDSSYVPQLVLIRPDEKEPIIWVRRMDAPGVLHTSWLSPQRIIGYPERYVGNAEENGFDVALKHVLEQGLGRGRLGLEYDALSWSNVNRFRARLPAADLVDASGLVTWLRLVKSAREVAVIREACAVADRGILRAVEVIRPGVRECDAAAEVVAALCRGTERFGGHSVTAPAMCAGKLSATPHLTWTDQPYQAGQHVNIELGGFRYRYAGAIMRTISLGPPGDRLKRIHAANMEGMEAALARVKPGALCSEVAEAFYGVVERHGYVKESRCGYPIGINWLEPTASLKRGDLTPLEPNMTFHLMLGMWMDDTFGYVASETFLVTSTGVECLTRAPRELFVVQ